MSNITEFTLKYPVERGDVKISVLKGRRPKVRDMRKFMNALDKDPVKAMEEVLCDLFQVEPWVVADLDIVDYAPMQKWFRDFLEPMKSESED